MTRVLWLVRVADLARAATYCTRVHSSRMNLPARFADEGGSAIDRAGSLVTADRSSSTDESIRALVRNDDAISSTMGHIRKRCGRSRAPATLATLDKTPANPRE